MLCTLLLLGSLVMAAGNAPENAGKSADAGNAADDVEDEAMEVDDGSKGAPVQKGLANALTHVTNENALAKLQSNLDKFEEKYESRLSGMEDVEVEEVDEETGEITIKAKENVKFFGFVNGKATKRFNVNAEGAVSEHAPWYSLFYSDVEVEVVEESEELEEEESEVDEETEDEDSVEETDAEKLEEVEDESDDDDSEGEVDTEEVTDEDSELTE